MERDRKEQFSAELVENDEWGDSQSGPVRGEGIDGEPDASTRQERRVINSLLPRDVRRDPWAGSPVQNVDELPSGFHEPVPEPDSRYDRRLAEGHVHPTYIDEQTGGDAGLVNAASPGMRAGYGPETPRDFGTEHHEAEPYHELEPSEDL